MDFRSGHDINILSHQASRFTLFNELRRNWDDGFLVSSADLCEILLDYKAMPCIDRFLIKEGRTEETRKLDVRFASQMNM